MDQPVDFLRGTLDLIILKTLSWGPPHGYGIARWLEHCTSDTLQVEEGTLYPALYRLEEKGWIVAEWGMTEHKRKAKFYRLSRTGREHLRRQTAEWAEFAAAVSRILLPAAATSA